MSGLSDRILGKTPEQALKSPLNSVSKPVSLSERIMNPRPDNNFKLSLQTGSKMNADQSSRVIKSAKTTGLPEDVVQRNLNDIENKSRLSEINIDKMSKSAPSVTRWVSQSPNNAAAGYKDLTHLNYMELQLRNIKNKFNEGRRTVELSSIGESAFLGRISPEQRSRQAEIEKELAEQENLGIDGYFEGIPGAISNQLPILAKTIEGKLKGAAVGAAGGAVTGATIAGIAGQLGPQAATPEEVVTVPGAAVAGGTRGAIAGWRYGAAVEAGRMEAGLAYLDYEKITDENGRPIDPAIARGAAAIVGVVNGSLEAIGAEKIFQSVPGLRRFQREGLKKALKNPSVRSTIINYAKNIGESTVTEGFTEFLQEIFTQSGGEIAQMITDGKPVSVDEFFARIFSDENIAQAKAAGIAGAQAGSGISAVGGGISTGLDIRKLREAKKQAEQIKQTGDIVESMAITKTNKESVEEMITDITQDGEIYLEPEQFQTYWQEQGIDPREVINEAMGDTTQFDEAIQAGQDIVVPASKYYTSELLGAGQHKEFFANEARTNPNEMSAREFQEEAQRLDEQEQITQEQIAQEQDTTTGIVDETAVNVRQVIKDKLTNAGFDSKTADTYAQLYESTFSNLGQRTGIDATQLFEQFAPEINRLSGKDQQSFIKRAAKGIKQFFQKGSNSTGLTETKEFKNWFGDSKVVDENGDPLVVYHGTTSDFDAFEIQDAPTNGSRGGEGFYFTANPMRASGYAKGIGGNIKPVYLKAENIFYSISQLNDSQKEYYFNTEKPRNEILKDLGFDAVADGKDNFFGVVVFDPTQIKSVNNQGTFDPNDPRILFQDENKVPRGSFTFGNGTFNINLLEDANLSTFLHETGHFYLEVLGELIDSGQSSDQLNSDYETLLNWFGVESRDQITTEHHEQFAKAFEAYLMEGNAPSSKLRKIFARFKVWLTSIYGTLTGLNVNLNDDVRGVFDRLIATDAEIEQVEGELNIQPLFTDTTILGSKAEQYKNTVDEYRRVTAEQVADRKLKDYQREQKKWYKDELEKNKDEVRNELNTDPTYIAWYALRKGTTPDGTPYSPDTLPPKLNRKAVEKIIGKDRTRTLPKGIFAKDGAHPGVLAELFNFSSDLQMLEALEKAEAPNDYVDRVAEERMSSEYPDISTQPDQLRDEILKDIHSESRSKVLRFELDWLANEAPTVLKEAIRRVSRRVPSNRDVKAYAKSTIGSQTVSKLRPDVYLRAEKNAARDAGIALSKGDLDTAFEKKRIELINHELYKQAIEARESIEKSLSNFRKIARSDKKLAKSRDIDLVNAARAVLADYGIGDEGATPESFLENMRRYDEDTYDSILPLIQTATMNSADYRTITYSEFVDLANTVDALWDLSRSNKLMDIDGEKVERDEVLDELTNRIDELSTPKEKAGYHRAVSKFEKTKIQLLGLKAALTRVENWVDAMDGSKFDGAFRKYIFNPISEGSTQFRVQKKEYIKRYLDIIKTIEADLINNPQKINANELNYEFANKSELLGAMLHTGNQSNLEKLIRGRNWGDFDENGVIDRSRWDAFVERMQNEGILTKNDYEYLQSVWDLLEELKPAAQKAHKAMYGHYFNEITANEIETPFGMYRGGYVPAIADPFVSEDQKIRNDRDDLEGFNNSFMFPTTGRGFTKNRALRYAAPLQMNLALIPGHIDKVLRFVNIEPHVKDVAKIVNNGVFRSAMSNVDSEIVSEMLVPWLQRAARQQVETPSRGSAGKALDAFMRALRRNTGINIMAGNVVNTLQQFTGLSIAAIKVKPKYLRNAIWQYMRSPKETAKFVNEASPFMATRTTTNVIEIQGHIDDLLLNPNNYEKARNFARKHAYFMQSATQNIVDIMTWIGKYNEVIEAGATEKQAVRQADSAVRQTQGSFNAEDISRFESGSPFMRAFTMFYSYFNMQANLLGSEFQIIARELGLKKGAGRLLYLYTFGFLGPAFISELLVQAMSGEYDQDDDDDYLDDTLNYFIGSQVRTATALFPGLGPIAQVGINKFNDKWYDDRISTSPAVSMLESGVSSVKSVPDAIRGNGSKKKAVRDVLSALGLLTGVPLVFISRPVGYLSDVSDGRARPTGPIDFTRGLITGRSR